MDTKGIIRRTTRSGKGEVEGDEGRKGEDERQSGFANITRIEIRVSMEVSVCPKTSMWLEDPEPEAQLGKRTQPRRETTKSKKWKRGNED
jgi:hypothetical protein